MHKIQIELDDVLNEKIEVDSDFVLTLEKTKKDMRNINLNDIKSEEKLVLEVIEN